MKLDRLLISVLSALALSASAFATTYTFRPTDSFGGDSNVNDLGDLDHTSAYTWGITGTTSGSPSYATLKSQLASGRYAISGAQLTIANLYNWDALDTNNNLFIHLLDNPKTGVKRITDDPTDNGLNQGVLSDYFAGKIAGNRVNGKWVAYGYAKTSAGAMLATGATNILLTQYHDADGPITKPTFEFSFGSNPLALSTLTQYIANGHTGDASYADFGLGFDPDCHFYNDGVTFTITTREVPDAATTAWLVALGLAGLVGVGRRRGC